MSDVQVMLLKLTSGEEIICKVDDETSESSGIEISKPLVVFLDKGEDGRMNVGFAQFMVLAADAKVSLNGANVVGMAVPEQSTIDNYLRIIGDRVIDVPPEKSILLPN